MSLKIIESNIKKKIKEAIIANLLPKGKLSICHNVKSNILAGTYIIFETKLENNKNWGELSQKITPIIRKIINEEHECKTHKMDCQGNYDLHSDMEMEYRMYNGCKDGRIIDGYDLYVRIVL